ncbi:IS3 family transposase [Kribbella sp. CA-294648]|uniref:IS3 family transposase n=1 Tax=Kribbella sp. CA-294648 TaxID=3239948 RepID=UPI003D8FD980
MPRSGVPLRQRLPIHVGPIRQPGKGSGRHLVGRTQGAVLGQPGRRATVKTELIHRRARLTRKAATSALFDYIESWHNTRRRHSTLGDLSPATYESTHATPRTNNANQPHTNPVRRTESTPM